MLDNNKIMKSWVSVTTCVDPEGVDMESGTPLPLENHKAIGFLSNTGLELLENHKANKPTFNVGPIKWHFANDGPLLDV